MIEKVLFIDRDGTLIEEPKTTFQIDSFEKLRFLPGAISSLRRIVKECDYTLVMATNQDGLGTPSFPERNFWGPHNLMLDVLRSEGIEFADILIDRSFEHENSSTRKPGTGMFSRYMYGAYDLEKSYVIGDRITDAQLATNLGAQAILLGETNFESAVQFSSWSEIAEFLCAQPRRANLTRKTKETEIKVSLSLDGSGISTIDTGIGFFDHMLTQVFYHGRWDGSVSVVGDLQIDEHHTIEDTALAIGECVKNALGSKKGICRYGFVLPMDESRAEVSLDFSGRSYLVWEASFKREKIGEMPTEMFSHFFKSFCDTSGCTLNIRADGVNEHHKIEAIFKAFGKALRYAVRKDPGTTGIPSTKGIL